MPKKGLRDKRVEKIIACLKTKPACYKIYFNFTTRTNGKPTNKS